MPISNRSSIPNCLNVEAKTTQCEVHVCRAVATTLYLCAEPDTGCNYTKGRELGQQFLHGPPHNQSSSLLNLQQFLRLRPGKWPTWPGRDKRLLKLGTDRDSIVLRKGASKIILTGNLSEETPQGQEKTPRDPRGKETREKGRSSSEQQKELRESRSQCPRAKDTVTRICPAATLYAVADKDASRDLAARRTSNPVSVLLTECAGAPPLARLTTPAWERYALGHRVEPRRVRKIQE